MLLEQAVFITLHAEFVRSTERERGKRSREKVKEQHGGHASLLP